MPEDNPKLSQLVKMLLSVDPSNTQCLPEIVWNFISTLDEVKQARWHFRQTGWVRERWKIKENLKGNKGNMHNFEML